MAWSIGKPKAAVLPVPVCAWPIKSVPFSTRNGIDLICISVGVIMLSSSRACIYGLVMPMSVIVF
jgi:hypothetical protein